MVKRLAPDRGDIIWVALDSSKGHEQKGTRPAVVLTPKAYNSQSSLVLACPMTTKVKGYPFEVVFYHKKKKAAVLVDQVKSLDWSERMVSKDSPVSRQVMDEITQKLSILLGVAT